MTPPRDLSPFLDGLPLDFVALEDARAFARDLASGPDVHARLEDLLMCFVHFTKETTPTTPGQTEALHVFRFAVSGLWAFLEGQDMAHGWATLARARLWAVNKCQQASTALPLEHVEALHHAFSNPHLLPAWGHAARQGQQEREAGHLAAWWAVSHLLEAAPTLEDGEAEDLTAATLEALAPGLASRFPLPPLKISTGQPEAVPVSSSPDVARALEMIQEGTAGMKEAQDEAPHLFDEVPGLSDFVPTVQHLEVLEGGRVRLEIEGGEGYEVRREDCTFLPLPAGAVLTVFPGTPDAVTLRLEQPEARQVFDLLGFSADWVNLNLN